jgi:outer membrane lipoprotein-sorting protein
MGCNTPTTETKEVSVVTKSITNEIQPSNETKTQNDDVDMNETINFDNIEKYDYRATMKFLGKEGSNMDLGNMTLEFDAPNKTRVTMDSPMGQMESIEVDGTLYTKIDGKWMKFPENSAMNENFDSFSTENVKEVLNSPTLKYIGKEDCSVGKCKVYQVYQNIIESTEEEKAFIYIDPKKNLPVKIKVEMATETMTMDYEYTDISIEVPEVGDEAEFKIPNPNGEDIDFSALEELNIIEGLDIEALKKQMEME